MKEKAPPISVVVSAWLIIAYGFLSLFRIGVFGSGLPSSGTSIAIWSTALACIAFTARSLYVGRNWVRLVLTALVAISVVTFPFQKPEMPEGPQLGIYVLQIIMPIVACALTFTRRARTWFQA